jgi:hypothetical protein
MKKNVEKILPFMKKIVTFSNVYIIMVLIEKNSLIRKVVFELSNFKMAYVIICHKNPEQINLLINTLNHKNVDFFLHVDKSSGIKSNIKKLPNIHFVKDAISVQWGHYSQIECILRSFTEINNHGEYNYIHVISGQDLPLVSSETIYNFFKQKEGKLFMEYVKMPYGESRWGFYDRVSVFYPRFLISRSKYKSAIRRRYTKLIMNIPFLKRKLSYLPETLYKGANWFSISGECMKYILEFTQKSPKYKKFFKNTFCGDEIFFQTIVLNSKFKGNVINDIKRYIDWETGPTLPRTLTAEDIVRIKANGNGCFWGRKFDMDVDRKVIDEILKSIA